MVVSWEVLELGLRNFVSMLFVVGVAVVLALVFVFRVYSNKPSQFDILLRGLFSPSKSYRGTPHQSSGAFTHLGQGTHSPPREQEIARRQSVSHHWGFIGTWESYGEGVRSTESGKGGSGVPEINDHSRIEGYECHPYSF